MAKKRYTWSIKYDLVDENIGEGGNGTVLRVKSKETGEQYALKVLHSSGKEKEARFRDEITIMSTNYREVKGIMPVFDWSKDELWYIMPVAKPIIEYIKEEKIRFNQILTLCISFAKELFKIHKRDITHRDIKPLNLYLLNGQCVFGDFGLADFPESENDFTRSDKGLGAIFTIAPEMKRNPKGADGKKADVFSFAKTMWMFLTLDENGFDGPYVVDDPEFSLSYKDIYKDVHLVELEELLIDATNTNPDKRPSMEEVYSRLLEYQRICNDTECSQESDWNYISRSLFGKYHPKSAQWNTIDSIIDVLNLIGRSPVYNHMLFSGKGGLDFSFSKKANEKGWIYIFDTFGFCHLVKPKCLYFEDFGNNFTWNYFLLELENADAIECVPEFLEYEILVEDYPGNYVSANYHQYGVYDYDSGNKLPEGYKVVHRYVKGKILIVFKLGLYNSINATYDGRHGGFSNNEFRKYIEGMIKCEKGAIEGNIDPERLLNKVFYKSPFVIENIEDDIPQKRISKSDDIKIFIENEITNWRIEVPSPSDGPSAYTAYYFAIKADPQAISSLFTKPWILTKSGRYIQGNIEEKEVFCTTSMEEAIMYRKDLEQDISSRMEKAGLVRSEYCSYVNVEMKMIRKPSHLFSYDEMIEKMSLADDRYNNTIVIDGSGEIQIIRDLYHFNLYPVSNGESWAAGNMYVGKYANLEDEKDLYMNLLKKWYYYLVSGKHQSVGYYENISQSEEELVYMIKEQMKREE